MPIKKEQKREIVENVKKAVQGAESVVFVNFHGLNAAETMKLRRALRGKEVGYTVAKKTLVRRALEGAEIGGTIPELEGELALAYGKDPLAPAREVFEFAKSHKEHVGILGGIFEKSYRNRDEMTALALIPPPHVLYGQFVNLINSPIQRFVVVLGQIADKKTS